MFNNPALRVGIGLIEGERNSRTMSMSLPIKEMQA